MTISEVISVCLSAFSLAIAFSALFHTYQIHKMDFGYQDLEVWENELGFFVSLYLVNRSGLPISIYKLELITNKRNVMFVKRNVKSYFEPYEAQSRPFRFSEWERNQGLKPIKMIIYTTRKPIEVDLVKAYELYKKKQERKNNQDTSDYD